jgi:uncharacterized protein YjbI with pentapeptide repeats/nitrogen fixation-related uncharacterized protein
MRQKHYWRPTKLQILAGIIVGTVVVLAIITLIGGYQLGWTWTGFGPHPNADGKIEPARTLWDWLQLLVVSLVLAAIGLLFNYWNSQTQQQIADDNQREKALQDYIDKMSGLLLDKDKGLRESEKDAEIQNVARTRTLSVLRRLDGERKGILLQFLQDSKLISKEGTVMAMDRADLSQANLSHAGLSHTNLRQANLRQANLSGAHLNGADLSGADLTRANLSHAKLDSGVWWSWAGVTNLSEVVGNLVVGDFLHGLKGLISWWTGTANLSEVDLRGADQSSDFSLGPLPPMSGETNLSRADLSRANLSYADLSRAKWSGAIMPDGRKSK